MDDWHKKLKQIEDKLDGDIKLVMTHLGYDSDFIAWVFERTDEFNPTHALTTPIFDCLVARMDANEIRARFAE